MAPAEKTAKFVLPKPINTNGGNPAPFLKAKDLPNGKRAKLQILGPPRPGGSRFGEAFIVPVKLGNIEFAFSVKVQSRNYSTLFDKFSDDPTAWEGTVEVERANYLGKDYVKVF